MTFFFVSCGVLVWKTYIWQREHRFHNVCDARSRFEVNTQTYISTCPHSHTINRHTHLQPLISITTVSDNSTAVLWTSLQCHLSLLYFLFSASHFTWLWGWPLCPLCWRERRGCWTGAGWQVRQLTSTRWPSFDMLGMNLLNNCGAFEQGLS